MRPACPELSYLHDSRSDAREEVAAEDMTESLPALLFRSIQQVETLGESFASHGPKLRSLAERLSRGHFHLAVLGQFKRGKSTLLNAMLAGAVLPTAVVPLTAIPTFIRAGDALRAKIVYQDNRPAEEFGVSSERELVTLLSRYVAESENPRNTLGVRQVEVLHPAPILRDGLVLIDTPGIGSTFRHNTEAALNFLPQCDAALFVVSADPPVTETELEFLKQVRSRISRVFFILNKIDYLNRDERQAALQFFQKVLAEHLGIDGQTPVFCVSARMGLEARQNNDPEAWAQSGMEKVERHLLGFLMREKSEALLQAAAHKAADIVGEVLMQLRLAVRALQMPLEDLQSRLALFERKIAEIRRERQIAGDLLAGDKKRMHQFLEEQADALRSRASRHLRGVIDEALGKTSSLASLEEDVRKALSDAIPGFYEHELGEMTALFGSRMAEVLLPHQQRADELIGAVRKAAADLFDIPYYAPDSRNAFEMTREPYWVTHSWDSTFSPIQQRLMDRLMPKAIRQSRIRKRVMQQVFMLVIRNVENLRWATYQSLDQTFYRFGCDLDERLAATIAATQGAIEAAIANRAQRAESISVETSNLEAAIGAMAAIQQRLFCMRLNDGGASRRC